MKTLYCVLIFLFIASSNKLWAKCELQPEKVGGNYDYGFKEGSSISEDAQYEVKHIFTAGWLRAGQEGGPPGFLKFPKLVLLNKSDCSIAHIFELEPKDPVIGTSEHAIMLNAQANTILIFSSWLEFDKSLEKQLTNKQINYVRVYDYQNFSLLLQRNFKRHDIYTQGKKFLSDDGNFFYTSAKEGIAKINVKNISIENFFNLTEEYKNNIGFEKKAYIIFQENIRSTLSKKGMLSDFEDGLLMTVYSKDEHNKNIAIRYLVSTGKAINTLFNEKEKYISAPPEDFEKKYNRKIQPVPNVLISPNDLRQGELTYLAEDYLKEIEVENDQSELSNISEERMQVGEIKILGKLAIDMTDEEKEAYQKEQKIKKYTKIIKQNKWITLTGFVIMIGLFWFMHLYRKKNRL